MTADLPPSDTALFTQDNKQPQPPELVAYICPAPMEGAKKKRLETALPCRPLRSVITHPPAPPPRSIGQRRRTTYVQSQDQIK